MLEIPLSFSGADCYQERGAICQNHIMDQKPNLFCTIKRSALVCLRGSRAIRRIQRDVQNADIDIETAERAI